MEDPTDSVRLTRREVSFLACSTLVAGSSGCGTLLYPERKGQPRTGPLDWGVVGMDAIGLIFFFVPGVIAFAVDIYNGTIFHPPGTQGSLGPGHLKKIELGRRFPKKSEIAQAVSQATQTRITLEEGTYLSEPLNSIEDFEVVNHRLLASLDRGELVYRCQSPE